MRHFADQLLCLVAAAWILDSKTVLYNVPTKHKDEIKIVSTISVRLKMHHPSIFVFRESICYNKIGQVEQ